jgi:hypothetical protein
MDNSSHDNRLSPFQEGAGQPAPAPTSYVMMGLDGFYTFTAHGEAELARHIGMLSMMGGMVLIGIEGVNGFKVGGEHGSR